MMFICYKKVVTIAKFYLIYLFIGLFFFTISWTAPMAYGGSQARVESEL